MCFRNRSLPLDAQFLVYVCRGVEDSVVARSWIVAARMHVEKQESRYRGDSSLISNYGGKPLCLSALEFGVLFSRFRASRPSWSNHPTASPTLQSLLLPPHQPLAITPNPLNGHYSPLLLLLISSFSSFTQPQYAN